ncbi:MAG: cobalt-precorrin-4/precorrin-4 C(11)-methyltransferase [Actinomycetia bacterium]|nr:cobalt-precorrin-4/precorrin-4 C(11)-methyltransferase [Actinomycetes bacterium]MCH9702804.1 cobalt-precorrin-4/precorrin-4 C(11)-methyltransferase [Actinomycetes bacterium]MCH9762193.1 cobalt-precorrin-4/precorrin-4 C(11)-methyltransferase [Actinomycetes bacterium]
MEDHRAVQFVGAGPGAEDLLTLRAARMLGDAETVLYPGSYLDPEILARRSPNATLVDTADLDLDAIVDLLIGGYRAGRHVVRLVSGDPSVYSAVTEQTRRLDAAGVPWSVTPGVPAYAAAAARVGCELTVPLVAQSVVLTRTRQRSTAMPETESLKAFAATRSTLVLHLAITRTRELMAELATDYGPDCPVVVVYRASQPQEQILRGTVAGIADVVEAAGLRRAAVIMVGRALAGQPDPEAGESHLYDPARDRSGIP